MPKLINKTKFYTFYQNNSGGSFDFDGGRGITHHVIIEATDAEDANERAEKIGLYFDGVEAGKDCECCGNRWSPVGRWGTDPGTETPEIYGHPAEEYSDEVRWMGGQPEICIHRIGKPFEFIAPLRKARKG